MKTNTGKINKNSVKPFLRWAGSKKKLIPKLLRYVNVDFSRYVEPFAGSARLYFVVKPKKAILGDINRELMQTYIEIKYRLPELYKYLSLLKNDENTYKELRKLDPRTMSNTERAARFIYLNRFCFNGLYRTNSKGEFNVPYSGEKTGRLPDLDLLKETRKLLRNTRLSIGDFEKTLMDVQYGDFVYLDPPFHVSNRRIFKEYNDNIFIENDLIRLRNSLTKIDRVGAKFLVSYAKCPEAKILTLSFHSKVVCVKRCIAGFSSKRRKSYELLISNFIPEIS